MLSDEKFARENLYEALDGNGHPLCLLPLEEILRQKLFHRSIALLPLDKHSRMLLQTGSDGLFNFCHFGPVPAGLGIAEYAEKMAFEKWKAERIYQIRAYTPCLENRYSFAHIFSLAISPALADMLAADKQKRLLADPEEINTLISFGAAFSPFFKLFFQSGGLGKSVEKDGA